MTKTAPPEVVPLSGPTGRLVAARREPLRQVLESHGVRNARIFGSVARGDDHQGSDLDILVDFAPRTSLFTILGVPVDLVPDSGLKHRVRVRVQQDLIAL